MFQIKDSLSALVSSLLVPFLLHHLPSSLAPSMSPLAVSGHFASLLSKHHNYGPQEQAIESRGEIWNSATIDKLNSKPRHSQLFAGLLLLLLPLPSRPFSHVHPPHTHSRVHHRLLSSLYLTSGSSLLLSQLPCLQSGPECAP